MIRVLRNIGRVIAGLLVPATIFSVVVSVFILALVPALAKPDNIKNGLAQNEIYADLLPEALPLLLESDEEIEQGLPIAFTQIRENMSADDWRAVANELGPPDYIQAQIESVLDGIYAYMMGAPSIAYEIDLDTLTERLSGEPGQRAITRITTLALPCTAEQIDRIRSLEGLSEVNGQLPVCSPANEADREILAFAYELSFKELTRFLQEEGTALAEVQFGDVTVAERVSADGSAEIALDIDTGDAELRELRVFFQTYEHYRPIFYLFPLMLFSLIVLFGVHSFKGFVRWGSITMLLSGVAVIIALLGLSVGILQVPQEPPPAEWNLSPGAVDLLDSVVSGILTAAFEEIGSQVFGAAAGLIIFGTIFFVISLIVPGPKPIIRLRNDSNNMAVSGA